MIISVLYTRVRQKGEKSFNLSQMLFHTNFSPIIIWIKEMCMKHGQIIYETNFNKLN